MKKFFRIKQYETEIGCFTANAIRHKIQDGTWINGREYIKSPEDVIFVNAEQVDKYIESRKPIIPPELEY